MRAMGSHLKYIPRENTTLDRQFSSAAVIFSVPTNLLYNARREYLRFHIKHAALISQRLIVLKIKKETKKQKKKSPLFARFWFFYSS